MKLKAKIIFLAVLCTLSSCATILNQSKTFVHVHTTEPSLIVQGNDSVKTIKNKALLTVERKNEPITIITITDSLKNQIQVNPRNSFAYYYNIFWNLGIGMIVEKNNPKRFDYPMSVRINPNDTTVKVYINNIVPEKGNLFLHISLPHINNFYLNPDQENTKINTGFWGATIGVDYLYSKNKYINLSASAVSDFFIPVPAAIDLSGEFELMSSTYLMLSNNHKINRFSFGYGISFGKNIWDLNYIDRWDPPPPTREPIKKSHYSFGLVCSSYYQIGKRFDLGIVYRPTFFRIKTEEIFKYEHLISIDFAWKIRLIK